MKKGKNYLAWLLALVLCLSVLVPMPVRAADVCFTAINDRVLELTNDTMPIWSGGVLYAPHSTFDAASNGVFWNLECSYNRNTNMITVFDIEQRLFLEFDLREGTCQDGLTGEDYDQGAILRGGRPYLPVGLICGFFDLTYSYRTIDQGKILRIRDDEAVLSDSKFLDAATNTLNSRLREYNQQNAVETPPAAPVTPSTPQPPVQQEPEDEQRVDTYLSFRCDSAELLEAILVILDSRNVYGMFFLTPELIEQRSDLVLWMQGAGHSVGLLAQGEGIDQVRAALEAGDRALASQVFSRTTVAYTDQAHRETLEQEGWICWNSTLDLTVGNSVGPTYFANRVIGQLGSRTSAAYLSMNVGENTVRVLATLLDRLEDEGFVLRVPLETRL